MFAATTRQNEQLPALDRHQQAVSSWRTTVLELSTGLQAELHCEVRGAMYRMNNISTCSQVSLTSSQTP